MQRLIEQAAYPLTTFKRCQLCGHTSGDICEFRMWFECDDEDKPEPDKVIVLCQKDACQKVLDDHPRLYIEVAWGAGGPGRFMLLCGNCPQREGTACKHPKLKTNGGEGLLVNFANNFGARICYHDADGEMRGFEFPTPAVECEAILDSNS